MGDQRRAEKDQAGMQAGGGQDQAGGPGAVPSEEVGGGPGLDPPAAQEDDEDAGDDEAFADRPTQQIEPAKPAASDTDEVAGQRPPADS